MIPTVILLAALIRRWWAVGAAAVFWPIAVLLWGDVESATGFLEAAVLGAANAVIGTIIGQTIEGLLRAFRRTAHT